MDLAYKQDVGTLDGAGKGKGDRYWYAGMQARNTVGDCTERRKEREDDMDKGNREVRGKRTAHSFTSH